MQINSEKWSFLPLDKRTKDYRDINGEKESSDKVFRKMTKRWKARVIDPLRWWDSRQWDEKRHCHSARWFRTGKNCSSVRFCTCNFYFYLLVPHCWLPSRTLLSLFVRSFCHPSAWGKRMIRSQWSELFWTIAHWWSSEIRLSTGNRPLWRMRLLLTRFHCRFHCRAHREHP